MYLCTHPLALLAMFHQFELLAFIVSAAVCRLLGFCRLVDTICYSEHWYLWLWGAGVDPMHLCTCAVARLDFAASTFKYSTSIILQAWAMKGCDWLLNENIETLMYSAWMNATERKEVYMPSTCAVFQLWCDDRLKVMGSTVGGSISMACKKHLVLFFA